MVLLDPAQTHTTISVPNYRLPVVALSFKQEEENTRDHRGKRPKQDAQPTPGIPRGGIAPMGAPYPSCTDQGDSLNTS